MNKIKYMFYGIGGLIVVIVGFFILQANKTCVVTYDTQGGTIYASQNIRCGDKATKPLDPVLEGYTFINWLDPETNTEFDFNKLIEKDTVIKAHYQKNE